LTLIIETDIAVLGDARGVMTIRRARCMRNARETLDSGPRERP
jgi:hypothetical protein